MHPILWITAKSAFVICYAFFLYCFFLNQFIPGLFLIPEWLAIFLFLAGSLFSLLAVFHLGKSLRVGLPTTHTRLKTTGLYRFSRNPIYTGLFCACIVSVIYCPHFLNLISAGYTIAVHHIIILREEKFLSARFGEQWHTYCRQTGRYITWNKKLIKAVNLFRQKKC